MAQQWSGPVNFGLFTHIERTSGSASLDRLYEEHLAFLVAAEQAGLWGFHLAEHHSTPLSSVPSPNLFLAAASQRTRRMRLGAMVYLLPFYNPLRLANEICMMDGLCAGRLEVGVGRGISPFEHALFGNQFLESRDIFQEALEVILKALTNERLFHRGEYFRYTGVPMELRPLQKPYPPLWYGGLSDEAATYAGRRGMNLAMVGPASAAKRTIEIYRAQRQAAAAAESLNPNLVEPKVGFLRLVFVADNDRDAEAVARPAHRAYIANIQKLWVDFGVDDRRTNHDFDASRRAGTLIVGSPAAVYDELAAQLEETGANYVMLNMKFGSLTAAQSLRSLELMAAKVLPGLSR